MNIQQFTLWDFTVNVIPGVLLLVLIGSLTPERTFNNLLSAVLDGGILFAVLLLVGSYALGRIFQEGFSREVDELVAQYSSSDQYQPAIQEFKDEIKKAKNESRATTRRYYWEEAQMFFSNQDVESAHKLDLKLDAYDLFNLSHEYVLGRGLGRVNRFLILSRFHRSLYVLAGLAIFTHVAIQSFAYFKLYNPVLSLSQTIIMIVILGIITVLSFKERWYFEHKVVDAMMDAFYSERCSARE